MGLPTEEYGSTPEEYATPQESCENQSFILKEFHIFFTLALKKSSILITCPWRIPDHKPSTRRVRILNAISPVSCRMGNILSTPFSSWGLAPQIPHTVGNHRTVEVGFDIFECRVGHIQTGNIHSNYIPKEHISGRKCLMPRENSTKRMFTHKDSI